MAGNFKLTQAVFIERVKALHPTLDFTATIYVNARTNVNFSCPEHGDQSIRSAKLLEGCGCPKCGRRRSAEAGLVPWVKARTLEEKQQQAARARAGRTAESNEKIAESQRQRWANDEAGKAAQSQRGKRSASQMWANLSPEERKAKMAAVRAAKHSTPQATE